MNTTSNKKSFADLVKSEKPVLIDFSAAWCGPCKMMSPILEEVKKLVGDKVTVIKIDVDKNPSAAMEYQISGVPTLILFKNGQIKWRHSGVATTNQLKKVIEMNL